MDRPGGSQEACPTGSGQLALGLPGEFGEDEGVGVAQEAAELRGGEGVFGLQADPVGARQVGGWDDAFAFDEVGEIFRGTFEGKPVVRGFEGGDGIDTAADLEDEVRTPLHGFRGVGEGHAEGANPFGVHVSTRGFS